ncbi:hypothetical protein [Stenotrophomonas phage RAS14]
MQIDYESLLKVYYSELESNIESLHDNLMVCIKYQLINQSRNLTEDGNDSYEIYRFLMFKKNWHHGCMYHEEELHRPPVFHNGRYIPGRYAHLTDD